MPKPAGGQVAGAGRRKGQWVGWNEGLTSKDIENLKVIADHTDEVLEALGTAITRGLVAIGIEAEADAAAICPVDTGRLRNSITHALEPDGRAVIVGTNVEYSIYVHEGTHRQKAQPFLKNAVVKNFDTYKDIMRDALS